MSDSMNEELKALLEGAGAPVDPSIKVGTHDDECEATYDPDTKSWSECDCGKRMLRADVEAGKFSVMGPYLVTTADGCTCGQPAGAPYGHEPGCGFEPIQTIELLIFPPELEVWAVKERALRAGHHPDIVGDCVEDGDPFPCNTIRILDWNPLAADREH